MGTVTESGGVGMRSMEAAGVAVGETPIVVSSCVLVARPAVMEGGVDDCNELAP